MAQAFQVIPILICGAFSSGKTAFIEAVSEIGVVSTEYNGSEPGFEVALDFGRITVFDQSIVIYLFANPGNRRMPPMETLFNAEMRRRCCYVAIVNSAPADDWQDYNQRESAIIIDMVRERGLPFIVVATKQDKDGAHSPEEIRALLQLPDDIKLMPCSAKTDPDSVRRAILELLSLLPQDEVVQAAQNTVRGMMNSL
jgi:uncharacterized protein